MTPVERAVDAYIRASLSRDPAERAALVAQCWAEDGRFVMRTRELRGRAALLEMMARAFTDPKLAAIRIVGPIDAVGNTFRFVAVADLIDGTTTPETLETGLIDGDGRISLLLTFTAPAAIASTS